MRIMLKNRATYFDINFLFSENKDFQSTQYQKQVKKFLLSLVIIIDI
jgi:hypothetical protein